MGGVLLKEEIIRGDEEKTPFGRVRKKSEGTKRAYSLNWKQKYTLLKEV